ncbi:hypothetical protein ACRAKI_17270 [Saccharothrix isguenensis]
MAGLLDRRGRPPVPVPGVKVRRIAQRVQHANGEGPPDDAGESGPARALKVVGSVLANATLLTALVFHFGFLYTQVFFAHFGVHYTLLGESTDIILVRGADGIYIPLAVISASALIVMCVIAYLRARLAESTWLAILRVCTPIAAVTGIVLVGIAVVIALDPRPFQDYAGLPGMSFSAGILLLIFSWRRVMEGAPDRATGTTVAEWVITFVLVSIGLFWAVSDYSSSVGVRRAAETEAAIPSMPHVLLFSAKSLNFAANGVAEVECRRPESAYRYRYDGLKLLLQSGDQYVLVPGAWTQSDGTAIVLPRSDQVRLEFTPAAIPPADTC